MNPMIFAHSILIFPTLRQERIMAPERAYRASERGSSKFYDERRNQLPAWKPAGTGPPGAAARVVKKNGDFNGDIRNR